MEYRRIRIKIAEKKTRKKTLGPLPDQSEQVGQFLAGHGLLELFNFERALLLRWPKGKTKVTESGLSPSRIPAWKIF